jgi:hypothetical protein
MTCKIECFVVAESQLCRASERTDIRPLLIGPFTLNSSGEPSPGSELAPWGRVLSE